MWLQQQWYKAYLNPLLLVLFPLHWLFVVVSSIRTRMGIRSSRTRQSPVSIWVVGNLTVGGAGKTPTTLALVKWLRQRHIKVGIVTRGYGGTGPFPCLVQPDSAVEVVGDEPLLLAKQTQVPMAAAPSRQQAVELLCQQHPDLQLILSDDGLQHYALPRQLEIVVVDGERGFGNGWRLPIGPLREPLSRLKSSEIVVQNGNSESPLVAEAMLFQLRPCGWYRVSDGQAVDAPQHIDLACAGIAHPQRFFNTLKNLGYQDFSQREFADHHPFKAADFAAVDPDQCVVMTEKDADKCAGFAKENWYYLRVEADFPEQFWQHIERQLHRAKLV